MWRRVQRLHRRGDHGSFSPTDTHISLMVSGPDFKSGLYKTLPTANVDIAPTVARILQFSMPDVQGRVLRKRCGPARPISEYAVRNRTHRSFTKTGLTVKLPTDLHGPQIPSQAKQLFRRAVDRDPYPRCGRKRILISIRPKPSVK